MDVLLQVSTGEVGGVIDTVGGVLFCVIVTGDVAVQPFAAVTVTVYVAGVVTESTALFPTTAVPLNQE